MDVLGGGGVWEKDLAVWVDGVVEEAVRDADGESSMVMWSSCFRCRHENG